jgi:hypothetical protein
MSVVEGTSPDIAASLALKRGSLFNNVKLQTGGFPPFRLNVHIPIALNKAFERTGERTRPAATSRKTKVCRF